MVSLNLATIIDENPRQFTVKEFALHNQKKAS